MHSHAHSHHGHHHGNSSRLWLVFTLNFGFTIVEFLGGYFTNSVAITSDAFHDMGDSMALLGAILLERYAHRSRSNTYSYGYKRFSLLSALLISMVLILSSVFIIFRAVSHLRSSAPELHTNGMLWLAIAGVLVNGAAAFQLFKKGKNLNQKAIMLHLLEDTLGWVAVLLGTIAIKLTGLAAIDPILSILIAIWILYNAVVGFRKAILILLQATPVDVDLSKVKHELKQLTGVGDIGDLHVWSLDGEKNIASVHVILDDSVELAKALIIKESIKEKMKEMGLAHNTVEIDVKTNDCEFEDCH